MHRLVAAIGLAMVVSSLAWPAPKGIASMVRVKAMQEESAPTIFGPAVCKVEGRQFKVLENGAWKPFFVKGINLGATLPGKYVYQFPEKAIYKGWFQEMAEVGFNTVRVYTIHPPHFYEALKEHNQKAKRPLYLIHGVWAEPPEGNDFFHPSFREEWRREMAHVVNVLHGQANIPVTRYKSGGQYKADVSPWTLAVILGREWESASVLAHNLKHPEVSDYNGKFVKGTALHAMEQFLAQSMDEFLVMEWEKYQCQRPIAFTNWPTLDPLFHMTEATEQESEILRKKAGLPLLGLSAETTDEDAIGLDMQKIEALPPCQGGLFASYHAYPYYPDFINLDPGYCQAKDALGPNNYVGYLADIMKHHQKHPVLISEFGVPSSRMVAHWQPQGMTHGGQTERQQGEQNARLMQNIYDSGCAGGVLFAWIDEWFKKNWLCLPFYKPIDNKTYSYNVMDAEENYGLIGYRPGLKGPSILIDGKADDWAKVPTYLKNSAYEVRLLADEGWFHVAVFTDHPLDFTKEAFLLGIDTLDPARGSHRFPWGVEPLSGSGLEFILLVQGQHTSLWVDAPYVLPEHRYSPRHTYRSVANEAGDFVMPKAKSNIDRIGRDGTPFSGHSTEIGWLKRGTQDRSDPAFDSRAEWMEGTLKDGRGFVEVRIPWTLLHVTDPSYRHVLDDPMGKKLGPAQSTVTEGFRINLIHLATTVPAWESKSILLETLPSEKGKKLVMSPIFTWKCWEEPKFHRFKKESYEIFSRSLANMSETPRSLP